MIRYSWEMVSAKTPAAAVSPDISEPAVHQFLIVFLAIAGPGLPSSSLSLLYHHESDWHQTVVCSEHLQSITVVVSQE